MSYLYLDESGNLGHQFQHAGVSRHFVITILEVPDEAAKKAMEKAVVKTMRHKIYGKGKHHRDIVTELKGAKTSLEIKRYFYRRTSRYKRLTFSLGAFIENTRPEIQNGMRSFGRKSFMSRSIPPLNKKESDP